MNYPKPDIDIDIIIPVYAHYDLFKQCLVSVLANSEGDFHKLILVDDANTDPKLKKYLDELKTEKNIVVLSNDKNKGFPYSVNKGLTTSSHDVIILNNDTVVTKHWIRKMYYCAYSKPHVATVTPLTNNGSLASIPKIFKNNPIPKNFTIQSFAHFIEEHSLHLFPEIPTCVGFCMYIKRQAIQSVGLFNDHVFGRGYEEENDFAMRAREQGFIHLLDDATFIYHVGQQSFILKEDLKRKEENFKLMCQLYPFYPKLIQKFNQTKPLKQIHRRINFYLKLPNISVCIFSFIFSLFLAELLLQIFLPFEFKRQRYMRTRNVFQYNTSNITFDKQLGYINKPNLNGPFNNQEFKTRVITNSLGFRDSEDSLDHPDILLLGDSFGFGWGVNQEQTIDHHLEASTHLKSLNMSVSGYGTIQEFLLLQQWQKKSPLREKTAIFLFYPNDLEDNMGRGFKVYPIVQVNNKNNPIIFYKPTKEGFKEWLNVSSKNMTHGLSKYSIFYDLFHQAILERVYHFLFWNNNLPARNVVSETSDPFYNFHLLISHIKQFSFQNQIKVFFVYIPVVTYYEGKDDEYQFKKIKSILNEASIPVIDLRSVLSRGDYFYYDDHWRPRGHYKCAQEIQKFLSLYK